MKRVLLLTGKPGTGKTALIKETISKTKIKAGGFYTEEIRTRGVRQGFRIITVNNQDTILAHVNVSSPYRVSKYKVDVENLNRVGVTALQQALKGSDLVVIDEIGKMELLSPQFKEAVLQAISSGGRVIGTIMLGPDPFADEIKHRPEVWLLLVTRDNHERVLGEVLNWLEIPDK